MNCIKENDKKLDNRFTIPGLDKEIDYRVLYITSMNPELTSGKNCNKNCRYLCIEPREGIKINLTDLSKLAEEIMK